MNNTKNLEDELRRLRDEERILRERLKSADFNPDVN